MKSFKETLSILENTDNSDILWEWTSKAKDVWLKKNKDASFTTTKVRDTFLISCGPLEYYYDGIWKGKHGAFKLAAIDATKPKDLPKDFNTFFSMLQKKYNDIRREMEKGTDLAFNKISKYIKKMENNEDLRIIKEKGPREYPQVVVFLNNKSIYATNGTNYIQTLGRGIPSFKEFSDIIKIKRFKSEFGRV